MATTIDTEIQKYLPLLGNDEKKSLLGVIKSFLSLKKENISEDIIQYNKELDDAVERIKNGEFTSHEDLEKEMDSW
jgi:hypothetical protein